MTKSKTSYKSGKVVIIGPGEGSTPEMQAAGYDDNSVNRIKHFAAAIVMNAVDEGISPPEMVNACINAIAMVINQSVGDTEHKSELLSAITEAFFAILGGDSDIGKASAN